MTSQGFNIYKRMPLLVQHAMISVYGWSWRRQRLGGSFAEEKAAFLSREQYTRAQWQDYANRQLRTLLTLAYERVPYYREVWRTHGLSADQLQQFTADDLPLLPVVDKQIAREIPQSLLLDGKPLRRHRVYHTSGSSGTPVATYWLRHEHQRSAALREARSHRFAGVSLGMPRATFGGRIVEPDPVSSGPFYRYNLFEKQIYFSAFHLAPQNAAAYVSAMHRHNTRWMTGYSHSTFHLASMILDQKLDAPALKAVVTTSEKITPDMRAVIEQAFSTRVFEEYGAVENTFLACECEEGRLHVSPDAGIIEIVDENFEPVPPGQLGEVLSTGFIRPGQPMIRYRNGDRAAFSEETCPCGREMPVLKEVLGRIEDTIYGPDGRRMVRFHGIFVEQPNVRAGQIVQESLEHIRVRIVPAENFGEADELDIIQRVQQRLTESVIVTVEQVDALPRTKSGKVRAVVSHLRDEEISRSTKR